MYRFLLLGPAFLGWIAVTLQAGLRAGFLLLLGLGFGLHSRHPDSDLRRDGAISLSEKIPGE